MFEAVGSYASGKIDLDELTDMEKSACQAVVLAPECIQQIL